jgi:hypothetical protein
MEDHPLGCEACRLTVSSTFFSPHMLEALKELALPSNDQSSVHSAYNQSLQKLLRTKTTCNSLSTPPRHKSQLNNVKIKGASDGSGKWRDSDQSVGKDQAGQGGLKEEMFKGCVGLTKAKAKSNRLLSALSLVHHSLFDNAEVARGTKEGYPLDFLEVVATPVGRQIVRKASDMACHEVKPSICPLSESPTTKIPAGDCQVCKWLLDDLEIKTLRHGHDESKKEQEQEEAKRSSSSAWIGAAVDEVDNVCDEIKWRHFESDSFDDKCQDIVEKADDKLLKHLNALKESNLLSKLRSSSDSQSIYSDVCGCKQQSKKKKKGKSKSTKEL